MSIHIYGIFWYTCRIPTGEIIRKNWLIWCHGHQPYRKNANSNSRAGMMSRSLFLINALCYWALTFHIGTSDCYCRNSCNGNHFIYNVRFTIISQNRDIAHEKGRRFLSVSSPFWSISANLSINSLLGINNLSAPTQQNVDYKPFP